MRLRRHSVPRLLSVDLDADVPQAAVGFDAQFLYPPEQIPLWALFFTFGNILFAKIHFKWYTARYEAVLFGDLMDRQLTVNAEGTLSSKLLHLTNIHLRSYYAVKENPGISFQGLKRAIQVSSSGQLRFSVDRLHKDGLVNEIKDGHFSRFFVVSDRDYAMDLVIARFTRPMIHKIGVLLLAQPMYFGDLCSVLGCSCSTTQYHLRRMISHGDVKKERFGKRMRYSLTNPELIRRVFGLNAPKMNLVSD